MKVTTHIVGIAGTTLLLLSGCANKPTNPSQITSAYVSTIQYEKYSCNRLSIEYNNLVRRENILVNAQNERIKSSQVQEFWLGYGTGDGIEASELANVRGEKGAVRKAMSIKGCKI
jgi:hypothetical protein